MSGEGRARSKLRLIDLAVQFFKKEGYKIKQENTVIEGYSGISRKFDLIVHSDHAKSYSNRRKITLLTRQKIAMSLR